MSAKFVWGIIVIVLGVLGVMSGLTQIAEISQLDQTMDSFARSFNAQPYMGDYRNAARDAKIGGTIKIFGGVAFCFLGTWLMQVAKREERQEWEDRQGRAANVNPREDEWL